MESAICVRFEDAFLNTIDKAMEEYHYATKAEFVREAMREKIQRLEKAKALMRLEKAYGFSKRKTTDKDLKRARIEAVKEIAQKLRVELD